MKDDDPGNIVDWLHRKLAMVRATDLYAVHDDAVLGIALRVIFIMLILNFIFVR